MTRIAIVERAKCNKKKCSLECIKFCPVNRTSDEPCVDLDEKTGKVVRVIRFRNSIAFDEFLNGFKAMRYPGYSWRYIDKGKK